MPAPIGPPVATLVFERLSTPKSLPPHSSSERVSLLGSLEEHLHLLVDDVDRLVGCLSPSPTGRHFYHTLGVLSPRSPSRSRASSSRLSRRLASPQSWSIYSAAPSSRVTTAPSINSSSASLNSSPRLITSRSGVSPSSHSFSGAISLSQPSPHPLSAAPTPLSRGQLASVNSNQVRSPHHPGVPPLHLPPSAWGNASTVRGQSSSSSGGGACHGAQQYGHPHPHHQQHQSPQHSPMTVQQQQARPHPSSLPSIQEGPRRSRRYSLELACPKDPDIHLLRVSDPGALPVFAKQLPAFAVVCVRQYGSGKQECVSPYDGRTRYEPGRRQQDTTHGFLVHLSEEGARAHAGQLAPPAPAAGASAATSSPLALMRVLVSGRGYKLQPGSACAFPVMLPTSVVAWL